MRQTAFRDKLAVAHRSNKFTAFCRFRFSLPLGNHFTTTPYP